MPRNIFEDGAQGKKNDFMEVCLAVRAEKKRKKKSERRALLFPLFFLIHSRRGARGGSSGGLQRSDFGGRGRSETHSCEIP